MRAWEVDARRQAQRETAGGEWRQRAEALDNRRRPIIAFGKRLKNKVQQDQVSILAAALTYQIFLALFPFFIFLVALSGLVASLAEIENPADQMLDLVGNALPQDAASVLTGQISAIAEQRNVGLLSFGFIAAIWAASGAMRMLMQAMNTAYDVQESRKWWKKIPLSVGLTLLVGAFIIGATAVLFAGQLYASDIVEAIGFQPGLLADLIGLLYWPAALVLIIIGIAFLYWALPSRHVPLRLITPGAVLFVLLWLVATLLFTFYVSNFGSYNATYGALGGVIILLIWIYFSSLLLLIGAEVNAVVDEQQEPGPVEQRSEEKEQSAWQQTEREQTT